MKLPGLILILCAGVCSGSRLNHCVHCDKARGTEADCNNQFLNKGNNVVICGTNEECSTDIRCDGQNRVMWIKGCQKKRNISAYDEVICRSENRRCTYHCEATLCNDDVPWHVPLHLACTPPITAIHCHTCTDMASEEDCHNQGMVQCALDEVCTSSMDCREDFGMTWNKGCVARSEAITQRLNRPQCIGNNCYWHCDGENGCNANAEVADAYCIPKVCPGGWIAWGNDCYLNRCGGDWAVDQATAVSACESEGGFLTSILSSTENTFIYTLTPGAAGFGCWIGLKRSGPDVVEWFDGSALGFSELLDENEYQCFITTKTFRWGDIPCNYGLGYICKMY